MRPLIAIAAPLALATSLALAAPAAAEGPAVTADDQDVSGGTVRAMSVTAEANGWLVVHRTDAAMKPGPVVGHAPIAAGETRDVAAILTEEVAAGDMLMLMVHGEDGGMKPGVFEYTLGAKEDGPVRVEGNLVTKVITVE